jgi:Flp pilus assembly protein TadD
MELFGWFRRWKATNNAAEALRRGIACHDHGDYDQAVGEYTKAIELAPWQADHGSS